MKQLTRDGVVAEERRSRQRRRLVASAAAAAAAGLGLLALGGCAQTKIDGGPGTWPLVTMEDSQLVPANTDPSRRTRVVVLPSEESPSARGAGLAEVASAALETMLGNGGVEIVERKLASRLDQELKLAEMRGNGSYGGPEVADYAIRVVMGTASWGSTYVPASSAKNPLTGKTTNIPAGYTHTGKSAMTARIYAVPSLRLVEQFPMEGSTSVPLQPAQATAANAAGLMRSATTDGVTTKKNIVLNEFSPKGYITERRSKDKASIFRVQLGKNTGTKAGDSIEIWTMQKVGETYDEVKLGTGVMSDVVGTGGSWIRVDDEKVARQVKKFDFVKVKNSTWFSDMKDIKNSLLP